MQVNSAVRIKMDTNLIKLIEWAVWVNLDKKNDIELILLKGHLLLETVITSLLKNYMIKDSSIDSLGLTFYKKLELLMLLTKKQTNELKKVKKYIIEINQLRNKLAHKYDFEVHHEEFVSWATNVLKDFPFVKFTKFTFRTKIVHAFATLTKCICEYDKKF